VPPESAFTPATEWCPHPEWWHADDAGATEDEVTELVAAFVRALQPQVCIETGTHTARTAIAIGTALQRNGHGHLWTVESDPLLAKPAEMLTRHLPVTVVCANSLSWDPPGDIEFAWFDSGIGQRQYEIMRYYDQGRFAHGALIGIHDTGPQHPVHDLLRPLFESTALYAELSFRTPRGVTFARVA
jgi:hypothetical protein